MFIVFSYLFSVTDFRWNYSTLFCQFHELQNHNTLFINSSVQRTQIDKI